MCAETLSFLEAFFCDSLRLKENQKKPCVSLNNEKSKIGLFSLENKVQATGWLKVPKITTYFVFLTGSTAKIFLRFFGKRWQNSHVLQSTVEPPVSGHPRDQKKVSA